jgi:lysozyme
VIDRVKIRNDLVRDEGMRTIAYKDSLGWWTIGVGHLLGNRARMTEITPQEVDALLDYDVNGALVSVERIFSVANLDEVRLRALVNMTFNRGEDRMRKSSAITPAIQAALAGTGEWKAVSDAILVSPWAVQVGARAKRLAKMFETGEDA